MAKKKDESSGEWFAEIDESLRKVARELTEELCQWEPSLIPWPLDLLPDGSGYPARLSRPQPDDVDDEGGEWPDPWPEVGDDDDDYESWVFVEDGFEIHRCRTRRGRRLLR